VVSGVPENWSPDYVRLKAVREAFDKFLGSRLPRPYCYECNTPVHCKIAGTLCRDGKYNKDKWSIHPMTGFTILDR